MVDAGWVEEPLLRLLPAPRPEWVLAPGALLLAVSTPPGGSPYRWYSAAAVAWACSPSTGTWAVLLAWEALRRFPDGEDPRLAPRCAWCRFVEERCAVMEPTRVPNPWGQGWWGGTLGGPTERAIEAAVASLPEEHRERASALAGPEVDLSALPRLRRVRG